MINGLSPNTFKDCTYSSSLMESTWDLAIRKQDPHPQMIKIITIFFRTLSHDRNQHHNENQLWNGHEHLGDRTIRLSNQPPRYPLSILRVRR